MLIAGIGGLGKEVLEVLYLDSYPNEIVFYDENPEAPELLYNKFKVLKSLEAVSSYFEKSSKEFITAIGHPRIREKLTNKLKRIQGIPANLIAKNSTIFPFNKPFHSCIIQPGVGISHNVTINEGCAIHINSTIGHSTILGKYVNVGPNATIIGPCQIGDYSYISAQAVVLPGIKIGKNVIVTAGKVVNKSLENFETF